MKRLLLVWALGPAACASSLPSPCTAEDRVALGQNFLSEVQLACEGKALVDCPAFPELEAKYTLAREKWTECQ